MRTEPLGSFVAKEREPLIIVEGVAIATATSNYLSMFMSLYALVGANSNYRLILKELKRIAGDVGPMYFNESVSEKKLGNKIQKTNKGANTKFNL